MEGLEGPYTAQGSPNTSTHAAQQKQQLNLGLLHPKQTACILNCWTVARFGAGNNHSIALRIV